MTPPSPPPSPKAALVALLADPAPLGAIRAAALLFGPPDDGTLFLRLVLLQAGLPVPGGSDAREVVARLVQHGWRALPASLEGPQVGDVFVVTDAERKPCRVGFVAKTGLDGGPLATAERDVERYGRIQAREVDFWLRLPG